MSSKEDLLKRTPLKSSSEIRKADDDTLLRIVEDRLSKFPYIRKLYTYEDIVKIIGRKRSLDNELLSTLVLHSPVYFKLLSNINENLKTLHPDGVIDVYKPKFQQWDLYNFRSTVVELYFAAVFKKLGYSIQFEPELPNNQRSEFLAKKGNITCYLEEKTIHREKTEKERWISDELADKLDNIDEPFRLSFELTDHVKKNDVDDISKYIFQQLRRYQGITDSFNFSYEKKGIKLVDITAYRLTSGEKGYVSGFLYPGLMTTDWSDIRNKISQKISQLHPDYPGVLVIHPLTIHIDIYDIFNAIFGDLAIPLSKNRGLVRLHDRILKQGKNKRVSAIIIHRRQTQMNSYDIENIVIFNRYADNPLPPDFLDFTLKEFKTLEQYNEELIEAERQEQDLIQSLYQYGVEKIANCYKDKGYHVKANIDNWEIPKAIDGYIPDIVAEKDQYTFIVQINTYLSLLNRMNQENYFKWYSQKSKNTKFILLIVDQDMSIKMENEYMAKYI